MGGSLKHATHQFILQGSLINVSQLQDVARLGVHRFSRLKMFFIFGLVAQSFSQSLDSNSQKSSSRRDNSAIKFKFDTHKAFRSCHKKHELSLTVRLVPTQHSTRLLLKMQRTPP